jgi:hypothetical protein
MQIENNGPMHNILNINDHTKTNFDLNDTISLNFSLYERRKVSNGIFAFYGMFNCSHFEFCCNVNVITIFKNKK